jgi:class 3 adenylate cyclase/DNA-binding response OmpR family regulator
MLSVDIDQFLTFESTQFGLDRYGWRARCRATILCIVGSDLIPGESIRGDIVTGERILVVDDSKENREFIVDYILKPNGFEPIEARDGVEALELSRRLSPDLMLLDLQMPRLDGTGVLNALRRENLNIPVVLMTFHGSEEIAVEVFRLGVRDYVKKPYTPEEMLAAIDGSLTEVRLRKEKEALTSRLLNANRELHSRIKELNTLYSIGKSVASLLNPAQLLARVVEAATVVTGAEQGSLLLVEGDNLILRAVKRRNEQHAHPAAEVSQDRLAERAVQSGKPLALSPQELARIKEKNPNAPSAAMFVPMQVSERVIGALGIENLTDNARGFSDHDGALLSALGDYAAIAIDNVRNFQQLEEAKEREKAAFRGAFERCVAPGVVDRVLRNPDDVPPGGQRCEISVLVADIRGYAAFGDQMAPEQIIDALNQYFTLATDVIFAREGTLDKSLGDAIMAFFDSPGDPDDHPYRAADAALALQATVAEFNARRGQNTLTCGIGLATGEAIVGSIGSPRAMNYTAIGAAVNLARQLQEQAEPGQILVEESLAQRLGDQVQADRIGERQFKGRTAPVVVYALRGLA